MKIFKFLSGVLLFSLLAYSCQTDDIGTIPNQIDNVGAITTLSNISETAWNAADLPNQTITFDIDVDGFGVTDITSVDIEVAHTAAGRLPNPDPDGAPLDQVFGPSVLKTVSTFPSTVTITAQEVADLFGLSLDSFRIGDNFRTKFPINTADGRRLTVAVSSDLCQQPAQPSFGGCNIDWSVICPAFVADELVGEWLITVDDFGTTLDPAAPITCEKTSETSVVFRNLFMHPEMYDVEISFNTTTGVVTVAKQPAWHCDNFGCPYGEGRVEGGGNVFACIGVLDVQLLNTVDAGSFGTYRLAMQKQ